MVIKFTSNVVDPPALIYMGRDKHENEKLIRWGWPEDVWFHVDKLSSAHVYLRLQEGQTIDDLPPALIKDCAQLVKQNSIEGCKQNDVDVVYTMWSNLKKTGDMVVGQVGFHRDKAVKKVRVETKSSEIIRRLEKTKVVDDNVDYQVEREERDQRVRAKEKEEARKRMKQEEAERLQREKEKEERSYDRVFTTSKMRTNKDAPDDDFM
ncbi:Coiled-coil domain-containing protein 25 [Aphelenchoides fujianensis]|nr:Coiled-coil domain-containing protein 25 [Aphelenchoides fujianensis]